MSVPISNTHSIQAVGPHTVQDMKTLERVQRRATKLVKVIRNMSYEDRLHTLKLPSVEERRHRGDVIETHKLLTGKVDVNHEQFFEVTHQGRTRGHGLKFIKKRAKHVSRLKFFSNRIVNLWNQLPKEVVESSTTNSFKNNLISCTGPQFPQPDPKVLS